MASPPKRFRRWGIAQILGLEDEQENVPPPAVENRALPPELRRKNPNRFNLPLMLGLSNAQGQGRQRGRGAEREVRNGAGEVGAAPSTGEASQPPVEEAEEENLDQYVEKLGGYTGFNKKFKTTTWNARFQITGLPADPEQVLYSLFTHAIETALAESHAEGIEADQVGVEVSSKLMETDIWHHIRPYNHDTVQSLMETFKKIVQSKKDADGVTIYGEPFDIKVTALAAKELVGEREIIGRGGARRRPMAAMHHRIKDKNLIKIDNNNSLCLFYALVATLMHAIAGWSRKRFFEYKHNQGAYRGHFQRDTLALMTAVGAPIDQDGYDARVWLPQAIDHWNAEYAGQHAFKAFVFAPTGEYRPILTHGPECYDIPLLLLHSPATPDSPAHFDGVPKEGNLFGQPYCLSCQTVYKTPAQHATSCSQHCMNCSRVGPCFPCEPDNDGYTERCDTCSKNFTNRACYQHHLTTNYCARSKKCLQCGVIWRVDNNTRGGRQGHVCAERFCHRCNDYHLKERGCFIEPLEVNNKGEEKTRILLLDMETRQNEALGVDAPNDTIFRHDVNFIAVKVICPGCIESGAWRSNTMDEDCEVCGPHRTMAFCVRDFDNVQGTVMDGIVVSEKPVEACVDWMINELPAGRTICFAHNGGRFNTILMLQELYKQRLNPSMLRRGNKLFDLSVRGSCPEQKVDISFRDSYNLLNMPLAALVPAFGLDVEEKPFFPYLANRPDNYGVHMPTLPPKDDYLYKGMMPKKKSEFDSWYAAHYNDGFHLDSALASYCLNDVEILCGALCASARSS